MYNSREKGDHHYIQTLTRHNDLFSPITIFFLGELKEKLTRIARVNTDASILDRAHTPTVEIDLIFI